MRLYFDTEFTGLQKDTTLISLGIIAENKECFYAKFTDYNEGQINDWIQENVIDNLELSDEILANYSITEVEGTKEEVKEALLNWLDNLTDDTFELVSDVCHYDMILFIDIFGGAFDLPEFISHCCFDINQDIMYATENQSMFEAFDLNREQLLQALTEEADDDLYYLGKDVLDLGEEYLQYCINSTIFI